MIPNAEWGMWISELGIRIVDCGIKAVSIKNVNLNSVFDRQDASMAA